MFEKSWSLVQNCKNPNNLHIWRSTNELSALSALCDYLRLLSLRKCGIWLYRCKTKRRTCVSSRRTPTLSMQCGSAVHLRLSTTDGFYGNPAKYDGSQNVFKITPPYFKNEPLMILKMPPTWPKNFPPEAQDIFRQRHNIIIATK